LRRWRFKVAGGRVQVAGGRAGWKGAGWKVAGWKVAGWKVAGWKVAGWKVAGGLRGRCTGMQNVAAWKVAGERGCRLQVEACEQFNARSTFTCNVQPSRSTFNLQPSTFNLQLIIILTSQQTTGRRIYDCHHT
jgi:hypothetical protein